MQALPSGVPAFHFEFAELVFGIFKGKSKPVEVQLGMRVDREKVLSMSPESTSSNVNPSPMQEYASLPDGWKQWLAFNLMNGIPPEELAQVLEREGFSSDLAWQEINQAKDHPYLAAGHSFVKKLKKRDWVLHSLSILQELSPNYQTVERGHQLSRDEFFERYYCANRPVVITGMLDAWPAMTQWTPEYFKSKFGHHMVEVQAGRNSDPDYEINSAQHKQQMPFGEYVDLVNSGVETNDFYMTANNTGINGQVLKGLWDDVPVIEEYLRNEESNRGFFWYGPKGIVTPLHHDLTNNFMAQVQGRKLIRLIPPSRLPYVYNYRHCYSQVDLNQIDYERFPDFRHIKTIDVVLEPGEILFLPLGYWHHVSGLDISITMTYTNFLKHNDFSSFYTTYSYFD